MDHPQRDEAAGARSSEVMTRLVDRDISTLLIAYHRHGDAEARERLLVDLMPLVRALASRYAGRGEPLEDLVQVGALGLIKAVDRFDVDRGVEFSSYPVPTIVGEIRRHFRDKAWALHVPRRLKELSVRLSRILADLKLAVTEACGNAVRHAYRDDEGPVTVALVAGDDRLEMIVEDRGSGLDPSTLGEWRADERRNGGMGMAIIR